MISKNALGCFFSITLTLTLACPAIATDPTHQSHTSDHAHQHADE